MYRCVRLRCALLGMHELILMTQTPPNNVACRSSTALRSCIIDICIGMCCVCMLLLLLIELTFRIYTHSNLSLKRLHNKTHYFER